MKLSPTETQKQLEGLPGWQLDGNAIVCEFEFEDFGEAMKFMNVVAKEAEALDHHPEWTNVYNKVSVRLTSHEGGGVTDKDIELAKAMNRLG